MSNNNGMVSCAVGCWLVAALGGVLGAILLGLLGSWTFLQAVFAGLVIAAIAGLLLSWLMCKPLPAVHEGQVSKPDAGDATKPAATAETPASEAVTVPPVAAAAASAATAKPAGADKAASAATAKPAGADKAASAATAKPAGADKAASAATAKPAGADKAAPAATAKPGGADNAAPAVGTTDSATSDKEKAAAADASTATASAAAPAAPAAKAKAPAKPKADPKTATNPEPVSGGSKPETLTAAREGGPDNLKQIKGVGPKLEGLLHSMGFYHFDQVASWGADEVAWVDENLQGFKGRVSRDEWVSQAKILAEGGTTEFSKKVKKGGVY